MGNKNIHSSRQRHTVEKDTASRLFMICGLVGVLVDGWAMGSFAQGSPEWPFPRFLIAAYCLLVLIASYRSRFIQRNSYFFTSVFLYGAIAEFAYLNFAYQFNFDYTLSLMVCIMVFAVYMRQTLHLGMFFGFTIVVTFIAISLAEHLTMEPEHLMLRMVLGMAAGMGLFVMSRDLGERLQKSDQLFRSLAENSADLVALHDNTGEIEYISPSVRNFLGYSPEELIGKNAFIFIHPEDKPSVQQAYYEDLFIQKKQVKLEYRLVRKDQTVVWVEALGTPLTDENDAQGRIMTTSRDVSARKKTEEDALSYQENLLRINNELDQFAYVVSHDLKAPLRGISNLSTFIEEDLGEIEVPEEVAQNLHLLRSRVTRLEELINDVLTYSRAGRWPVQWEELDLVPLLHNLVDSLAIPDGFNVQIPAKIPPICAAKVHLDQIFTNLIINAWTHHDKEKGHIVVTYNQGAEFHFFAVSDDGPGIEAKYHQRIFEVFQQLQSRDRKGGTGVGLAVVRKIIRSAGGEIEVDSSLGNGTTFRFTWPRNPLPSQDET